MANLVYAGTGHVFPPIVRQFNMLRPARWRYPGESVAAPPTYVVSWSNADYFKDWVPFNLQANQGVNIDTTLFGAFTTAPDGTTDTARLLRENSGHSEHAFLSGCVSKESSQNQFGKLRLSGVFKYAGRRIILFMGTMPLGLFGTGVMGGKAIFDLQNGQVAQDLQVFGSPLIPWTALQTRMQAIGNGWYLCSIEAVMNLSVIGGPNTIFCKLSLDNGVGTEVESSNYRGNDTSGVYAWRSNLLPARAWDLTNTTVFFDDFDDDAMGNIDLGFTKAPGHNWYRTDWFPGFDDPAYIDYPVDEWPLPYGDLTCADSVLTITNGNVRTLSSFESLWEPPVGNPDRQYTSEYVGRGYVPPFLIETRTRWDNIVSTSGISMWNHGIEYLCNGRQLPDAEKFPTTEVDFYEILHANPRPGVHIIYIPDGTPGGGSYHQIGAGGADYHPLDEWNPNLSYGPANTCGSLDIGYKALTYSTIGVPPASEPAVWGPFPETLGVLLPVSDYSQFHTYSTLWFPATDTEPGQFVMFFDYGFCCVPLIYGPGLPEAHGVTTSLIHQNDWQQYPIFIGGGPQPIHIDWVKVTQ